MSDIPSRETGVAELKRIHLRADGMEPVGWIFIEPDTGRRATLDYWGRVQWWDVDGSGRMHAESARVAELEADNGRLATACIHVTDFLEQADSEVKKDCDVKEALEVLRTALRMGLYGKEGE